MLRLLLRCLQVGKGGNRLAKPGLRNPQIDGAAHLLPICPSPAHQTRLASPLATGPSKGCATGRPSLPNLAASRRSARAGQRSLQGRRSAASVGGVSEQRGGWRFSRCWLVRPLDSVYDFCLRLATPKRAHRWLFRWQPLCRVSTGPPLGSAWRRRVFPGSVAGCKPPQSPPSHLDEGAWRHSSRERSRHLPHLRLPRHSAHWRLWRPVQWPDRRGEPHEALATATAAAKCCCRHRSAVSTAARPRPARAAIHSLQQLTLQPVLLLTMVQKWLSAAWEVGHA